MDWRAVRSDPHWKNYLYGLKKRRQANQVIVAIARHLLTVVLSVLTDHAPWADLRDLPWPASQGRQDLGDVLSAGELPVLPDVHPSACLRKQAQVHHADSGQAGIARAKMGGTSGRGVVADGEAANNPCGKQDRA